MERPRKLTSLPTKPQREGRNELGEALGLRYFLVATPGTRSSVCGSRRMLRSRSTIFSLSLMTWSLTLASCRDRG